VAVDDPGAAAVDEGSSSSPEVPFITLLGNPILRSRCHPVDEFGVELSELVDDMFRCLAAIEHGVGLSANQIGRRQRVFIFDFHDGMSGHVVNPVVTPVSREFQGGEEACLSLPGLGLPTTRLEECVVRGVDRTGKDVHYEGEGLAARCFQHELDHLDGKLYIDLHPVTVRKRLESEAKTLPWYGVPALDPRSERYLGGAGPPPPVGPTG
jgi:peptide deformylase